MREKEGEMEGGSGWMGGRLSVVARGREGWKHEGGEGQTKRGGGRRE